MPSDWDASSDEDVKPAAPTLAPPVAVPKKGKFADEDASDDDVKDDWDVSDDDDKPKKAAAPIAVGSMRNKGAVKQKIAQKEAAERARLEEEQRKERENDPAARRARERAAQLASDMDSAASLFGATGISSSSLALLPTRAAVLIFEISDDPLSMNCKTKEDFDVLAQAVSDSLIDKHASSPHFAAFVEQLTRQLASPLRLEELKKVRVSIAKAVEEKEKAAKNAGKGAGGKAALGGGKALARGKEDLSSYGEVLDDPVAGEFDEDEDFM
ncbi:SPOSA6832_01488, partial [Sporobolomyces salmonicolor]